MGVDPVYVVLTGFHDDTLTVVVTAIKQLPGCVTCKGRRAARLYVTHIDQEMGLGYRITIYIDQELVLGYRVVTHIGQEMVLGYNDNLISKQLPYSISYKGK